MKYLFLLCYILFTTLTANSFNQTSNAGESKIRYQNFKCNLFPTLGNRLNICWERALKENRSIQAGIDGIGVFGTPEQYFPKGAFGHLDYRFYRLHQNEDSSTFPLSGWYFQPSIRGGFTSFINEYTVYDNGKPEVLKVNDEKTFGMALLGGGVQFVLYKRFVLDLGISAGLLFRSGDKNQTVRTDNRPEDLPFRYGFVVPDKDIPFVCTGTVRLGYFFGLKPRRKIR